MQPFKPGDGEREWALGRYQIVRKITVGRHGYSFEAIDSEGRRGAGPPRVFVKQMYLNEGDEDRLTALRRDYQVMRERLRDRPHF